MAIDLPVNTNAGIAAAAFEKLGKVVHDAGVAWDKADSAVQALSKEFKGLSETANNAAGHFKNITGSVATFGKFLGEGSAAVENHDRALRQLGSAASAVEQATRGMVSTEQAASVQARITQAGLSVTADGLAALTEKARESALVTGKELQPTLDELTQALISGEQDGLRKYGIAVDSTKGKSAAFQQGLDQLTTSMKNVAPAALTTQEQMASLSREWDKLTSQIGSSIAKLLGFKDGLSSVIEGVKGFRMAAFGNADEELGTNDIRRRTSDTSVLVDLAQQLKAKGMSNADIAKITSAAQQDDDKKFSAIAGTVQSRLFRTQAHEGLAADATPLSADAILKEAEAGWRSQLSRTEQRALRLQDDAEKARKDKEAVDKDIAALRSAEADRAHATLQREARRLGLTPADVENLRTANSTRSHDIEVGAAVGRSGDSLRFIQEHRVDLVAQQADALRVQREMAKIDADARRQAGISARGGGGSRGLDPAQLTEMMQTMGILRGELSGSMHDVSGLGQGGGEDTKSYLARAAGALEDVFVDANHRAIRRRGESEIEFAKRRIDLAKSTAEAILAEDKRKHEQGLKDEEKALDDARKLTIARQDMKLEAAARRVTLAGAARARSESGGILTSEEAGVGSERSALEEQKQLLQTRHDDLDIRIALESSEERQLALVREKIGVEEQLYGIKSKTRDMEQADRDKQLKNDFGRQLAGKFVADAKNIQTSAQTSADIFKSTSDSVVSGFSNQTLAVIQGKKAAGQALRDGMTDLAAAMFPRALMEGGAALAGGFSQAAIGNEPGAAMLFASAAQWGIVAAIAGGGAALLAATAPSAASAGGGAAQAARGGSSSLGRTPSANNADNGGGNVFNMYYSGAPMMTQPELHRATQQMIGEAMANAPMHAGTSRALRGELGAR